MVIVFNLSANLLETIEELKKNSHLLSIPCYSKYDTWTSRISVTWENVRHSSLSPTQIYGIKICISKMDVLEIEEIQHNKYEIPK